MATIAHGGRFASLLIEEDREPEVKKTDVKDADKTKKKRKKKKPPAPDGDLQTMIFGGAKSKPVYNHSPVSPSTPSTKLFSEVAAFSSEKNLTSDETDVQFENEMREAMLESECQFQSDRSNTKEAIHTKDVVVSKFKSVSHSFSDDDHLFYDNRDVKQNSKMDSNSTSVDFDDGEFKEIKRKPKKGKITSQTQPFPHLPLVVELNTSPESSRANLARNVELEKRLASKNDEIRSLLDRNTELQGQVNKLNQDNLALADLLTQGELKSKAELIREIEGINLDKVEMADELQRLSEALEQERTKNKTLRTELQRIQNKK